MSDNKLKPKAKPKQIICRACYLCKQRWEIKKQIKVTPIAKTLSTLIVFD